MNCLVCGKKLINAYNTPLGAVIFRADGNYGSAVFDRLDLPSNMSVFLEAYICDTCLVKHAKRVRHGESTRKVKTTYTPLKIENGVVHE